MNILKAIKIIFFLILVLPIFSFYNIALAQGGCTTDADCAADSRCVSGQCISGGDSSGDEDQKIDVTIPTANHRCEAGNEVDLTTYIGCLYEFATYLATGLAILMTIWGGYKYITSQGNPDALGEAKEIIWGAIIGLLLLGLGYLILNSIGGGIV